MLRQMNRLTGVFACAFVTAFVLVQEVPQAQVAGPSRLVQQGTVDTSGKSGHTLFQETCAACHGVDGKGKAASVLGFDVPTPDFTDCNYASREPDADWLTIAHEGGPVRGFSPRMPAFGGALGEADLVAILGHIRTLCESSAWPRGELNLPRAFHTEKAYPEDEAVVTVGTSTSGTATMSSEIVYERRFGARNQLEVKVPFGASKVSGFGPSGWVGGAGDIALGFKRAVAHSAERGTILAWAGEVVLPTGDELAGLSKGTTVFESFVSFGQILPNDSFLQFQGGVELPVNTDRADREAFWRMAVGRTFLQTAPFGRAWTPMVELLAARELKSGEPILWDVVPQVQFTLNTRQHLMMSVGWRTPLNARVGRPSRLLVYLLWDWFDGGLRDGW